MLMVIFGAGASFDSCPTYLPGAQVPMSGDQARLNKLYRPPLANELFENRPLFAEAIDRFPECRTIVPRLRNLGERSLEATLEDIRSEEHTSELQSHLNLVCRLLLEKKKKQTH